MRHRFDDLPDDALILRRELPVGYSESTLWRKIRAGLFPEPVPLPPGVSPNTQREWRVGTIRTHLRERAMGVAA